MVQAKERCFEQKLDVQKPELELEQAADVLGEVDKMVITNELCDADLLAVLSGKCT